MKTKFVVVLALILAGCGGGGGASSGDTPVATPTPTPTPSATPTPTPTPDPPAGRTIEFSLKLNNVVSTYSEATVVNYGLPIEGGKISVTVQE